MLEAIEACERIAGRELRVGALGREPDRRSPLVDLRPRRVPRATTRTGTLRHGIEEILREIHEHNVERWTAAAA